MGGEQPSLDVLVERIGNVQADVSEIKGSMATRNDQAITDRQITGLTAALAAERTERIAGIEKEQVARSHAIAEEKRERVEALKAEATARAAVAARQQVIEDRDESRKWYLLGAIILGGVSLAWNIVGNVVQSVGAGG